VKFAAPSFIVCLGGGGPLEREGLLRTPKIPALFMPLPVLITESPEEFNRLYEALKDDLKIVGTVEHLILAHIAELAWEIGRYRRAKVSLINSAVPAALKNLLRPIVRRQMTQNQPPREFQLLLKDETELRTDFEVGKEVDRLAHQWFVDEDDRKLILEMLAENKLDEYVIEMEAMRIVAPELERFDRLLASLEWRLDKALRCLAEFRGGFGRHLRASVDRVIDGKVLAVEVKSKKSPPTAA